MEITIGGARFTIPSSLGKAMHTDIIEYAEVFDELARAINLSHKFLKEIVAIVSLDRSALMHQYQRYQDALHEAQIAHGDMLAAIDQIGHVRRTHETFTSMAKRPDLYDAETITFFTSITARATGVMVTSVRYEEEYAKALDAAKVRFNQI